MKQFFKSISDKTIQLLESDTATTGRSRVFRVAVISLLTAAAAFNLYIILTLM